MNGGSQSISQWLPQFLAVLSILAVAALGAGIAAVVRLAAMNRRVSSLLGGTSENVEELLLYHLRERQEIIARLADLEKRTQALELKLQVSKRHLGLVRYDAFPDVGGNQSFAIALFDDQGDGAVVTGITGREDTRVYCKPLVRGRSDRPLSQEEERALDEAFQRNNKAVITS